MRLRTGDPALSDTLLTTALALLLLPSACRTDSPSAIPFSSSSFTVASVAERGPYRELLLQGAGDPLVFYFAPDAECDAALRVERSVDYVQSGPLGRVRVDGTTCVPVGTASLRYLREQRPRPVGRLSPRGQAVFGERYRDAEVALVRGRFPMVGYVGWSGGEDAVAVLPLSPACAGPLAKGVATIEFREAGREPLRLVGSDGPCPVLGLIRPLSKDVP